MQVKTKGIVLHSLKYSDSASIVTIYTHHFGRLSFMMHGLNKKKTKFPAALLQALSIIELDMVYMPGKELQRVKELSMAYPFRGIPTHPLKNAIALFISEILYRTLHQTEADENLFQFLENSIQQLDCSEGKIANFHLVFLIKLTRYLGFEPNKVDDSSEYFDLMNGVFLVQKPLHTHYLMKADRKDFAAVLSVSYDSMNDLVFNRAQRMKLLDNIIEYYRLHLSDFKVLSSLSVLQQLFD